MLIYFVIISGLDECGRGSLVGPLVGALAIIHTDIQAFINLLPSPLRDSKKLSTNQREKIFNLRDNLPITYAIESISVDEINTKGITWANTEVFLRLISKINADQYLVDGNLKFSNPKVTSIIKGDNLHPQIMLASIIAKVFRDQYMTNLHQQFPQYGWNSNRGYGAKVHTEAIKENGPTIHHRSLFIRNFV